MPEHAKARAPLDAVLFDAGGTLVRLDFEWMSEVLATRGLDIPAPRLRRSEIEGRRRYDAGGGHPPPPGATPPALGSHGNAREYFAGTLEAAGVPVEHMAAMQAEIEARGVAGRLWGRPAEGARDTLDAVHAMGLRVGVVSNSDGRAEQHLRDCGVLDGVECVIDSHLEGVEKPDPKIFRIALERMGLSAERTIYVGDLVSVDVVGARRAGLTPVLIDPFGDYAPPGVASIPIIGALPGWIHEHRSISSVRDGLRAGTAATEEFPL